jgi:hypothetical protein
MLFDSQSHDEYSQEFDEHNAPTEPLNPFPLLSHPAGNSSGEHSAYPFLPPLPASAKNKKGRRPAVGAQSAFPVSPDYPVAPPKPVKKKRAKSSTIPVFVGIFFVTVQLLLLVRFFLKLFESRSNEPWVALVYTVSNIFALPFRLILQNIPLPIPASLELYTLLAILVYGLLSRILVHILKAILR